MKKWNVYGLVTGTKHLGVVEADTKDEAEEKGFDMAHVSLCHQCSSECSDPQIDEVIADEEVENESSW